MENEILNQILKKLATMEADIKDLKQGQVELKAEVTAIKEQQRKDSNLLQIVFEQTIKLTEHKSETEAKFEKLKSVL